jgi:parallel beta-helix repeat protein
LLLFSGSSGSTIRGLVIGNFPSAGISVGSDNNRVNCNHVGVGVNGYSDVGNGGHGIEVSGSGNTIGGLFSHSQRNVISGNSINGVYLHPAGGDNLVANNFVGTTASGLNELSNYGGISIGGDSNQIGGVIPLARNLVSGNLGTGIYLNNASANLIVGNHIGVARDSISPLPNNGSGIELVGETISNTIGSTAPGGANLIVNSGMYGVRMETSILGTPTQNQLRGNIIYNNGDLGIDLGGDGVDTNDTGDGDTGENNRQNYPVLLSGTDDGTISGILNSQPNMQFTLDFYRNDLCDPSGFGAGQEFLGTGLLTSDSAGDAAFALNFSSTSLSPGDSLTATATDPDGNTSEFSACVTVTSAAPPTPTNTLPPGPSPTPTWTPSPGPSPTPTRTPTSTWTSTPGPSPTPTQTATTGPSPTPPPSATPGPSPTPPDEPQDYPIYLPVIIRQSGG